MKVIIWIAAVILFFCGLGWTLSAPFPHVLVRLLQNLYYQGKNPNTYEIPPAQTDHLDAAVTAFRNITYPSRWPSSSMDIYQCSQMDAPVMLFVHGGGYVWGDKDDASFGTGDSNFMRCTAHAGFHVVSINYALYPAVVYPDILHQIDDAVAHLTKHAREYGISTERLILCGTSAGGQIIGQYVNAQLNEAYGKQFGLKKTLRRDQLKAVVFNSALLEPEHFDDTGNSLMNAMFGWMGRCYFGNKRLAKNESAKQAAVTANIPVDYPPVYITDGNVATFTKQAIRLDKHLTALDIPHVCNLYEQSEAKLMHGYECKIDSVQSKDNFEKMIRFLDQYTKGEEA